MAIITKNTNYPKLGYSQSENALNKKGKERVKKPIVSLTITLSESEAKVFTDMMMACSMRFIAGASLEQFALTKDLVEKLVACGV